MVRPGGIKWKVSVTRLAGVRVVIGRALGGDGALALFLFFGLVRFVIFRNGCQYISRSILNQDVLVSFAATGGLVGRFAGLVVDGFPSSGCFGVGGLALSFNGIGVLVAISGFVAPVWAMLAMAASVRLVLINSFAGRLLPQSTKVSVESAQREADRP